MRAIVVVVLILLMTPTLPHAAQEELQTSEWYLASAFYLLLLADYSQTQTILSDTSLYERNQLLGQQPNPSLVDHYFIATAIAYAIPLFYLPLEYRMLYQGMAIGIEANVVWNNNNLGIGMTLTY